MLVHGSLKDTAVIPSHVSVLESHIRFIVTF